MFFQTIKSFHWPSHPRLWREFPICPLYSVFKIVFLWFGLRGKSKRTCFSGEESFSLFGPEEVQGLDLPLLALVDPPQAKDVEQDGQQHHQDAEREEVVVVDKGGAQPAGVALSQRLLLKVPADNTSVSHTRLTVMLTATR